MKLSSLVTLAMLPVCALVQGISIASPSQFTKVKPGASLTVQILQDVRDPHLASSNHPLKIDGPYSQNLPIAIQDPSILISMLPCDSDKCDRTSPTLCLGTILHAGSFHPELTKGSKLGSIVVPVSRQNITVDVPASLKHGSTAQLIVLFLGPLA